MKGFIIAGTHSGCGKTTITLGILAALKKKGLNVQAFKAGPDFIDAGLHRLITNRPSRNLDLWMCGEGYVKDCFKNNSDSADISIVEGVMGLYDGEFNTARLAHILGIPVILIVDAYGMAESAGAIVKGFANSPIPPLAKGGKGGFISGVIFNRISSKRHYERVKNSVHDVPVLGYLPRDLNFEIPHRHLGLTVAEESPISGENIERLADAVLEHVDIDTLMQKSKRAERRCRTTALPYCSAAALQNYSAKITIAIAYDKAFCFYYEDNLDLLREAGAEIVVFSPLSDSKIPNKADAIYIGGGYPELFAAELSANSAMRNEICKWAEGGKPLYAECGGLIYLSKGIHDFDENFFEMAGVFPFKTEMKKGGLHLGYREIQLKEDCILGKVGDMCRGHEFHYSSIVRQCDGATAALLPHYRTKTLNTVYALKNNSGEHLSDEGYRFKNTLASYAHIHFGSNPAIAENFVNFIKERQWRTSY